MMKTKRTDSGNGLIIFTAFLILLIAYAAQVTAAGFETVTLSKPGDAVVLDKAPNGIFIKDRTFPPLTFILVTSSSTIRGPDGKQVSFTKLPIPCKASVVSRRYKGKDFPVLVSLDVQQYAENAKKAFTIKKKITYRPQ